MTRRSTKALSRAQGSPWIWAGAGAIIGLVVTLVLQTPAAWLVMFLSDATSGKVTLLEARGTAWTGSARPAFDGLAIRFGADCCTPQPLDLQVVPGWGRVALTVQDPAGAAPQRSVWPAVMLAGLGTPWNTVQIEGQLSLMTQGLSVEWTEGRLAVAGRAELQALRISSRLSTLRPMGSYRITLVGGNTATLEVSTIEGSLQLAGTGRWVGSRLRFEGTASAAPEREAALSNLLNIIGRRTGPRAVISLG